MSEKVKGTPQKLMPVLANIGHKHDSGYSEWYEVVYYNERWESYEGSETFENGEEVNKWVYVKDAFQVDTQYRLSELEGALSFEELQPIAEKWDKKNDPHILHAKYLKQINELKKKIEELPL